MKLKIFLWLLLVVSALGQILVSHQHRQLMQAWQQQDSKRVKLQQEYTRLLLERSTLGAHNRLDRLARQQLNMTEPKQIQVLSQ